MWYMITATYESGKVKKYVANGMIEAMKRVARIKATDEVNMNIWNQEKDKLVSCKAEKATDEEIDAFLLRA